MKITARTLADGEEHFCGYPTCGDWRFWTNGEMECTVSKIGDSDAEFVVLLHEIVEGHLCRKDGITHDEVSQFDEMFEAERDAGKHSQEAEPGDDPRAPYRRQHQRATIVEMIVLEMLGGSWPDHCTNIAK